MSTATTKEHIVIIGTTKEHIVIIGGGIIGVASAYYLTTHEKYDSKLIDITIIEASEIAAGASGKAGGLLASDWHGPTTASLASLSYKLHAELANKYDGAKNWGYRNLETLSLSADLTKSSSKKQQQQQLSNLVEGFDWLNKEILTETSIIGTTSSTSQAHPKLLTLFLSNLVQEKGVKVVYAKVEQIKKVEEVLSEGKKRFLIQATSRDSNEKIELSVSKCLISSGPWTGELLKKIGSGGGLARNITGSRAHSAVIKSSKVLPAQALFTSIKHSKSTYETQDPEIYNRPDNTAYICGPVDDSILPSLASLVTVDPIAIALLVKQAACLSPNYLTLGNEDDQQAQVVVEQACYLPVGSGDPVIGVIEESLYVASGHSCWGIQNGPGTGLCVAELIMDGKVISADISALAP